MTREIHNSWREFHAATEQVLGRAQRELCIWDNDLAELRLDMPEHIDCLRRILIGNADVRIALKRTDHLHRDHPRLVELFKHYSHTFQILQVHAGLENVRDTLVIADRAHVVIRPELAQPRSTHILDDPVETAPWLKRFEAVWAEGGIPFSPTTLGL
ncbi:MAG: hypothetical protein LBO79_06505 [Zoogloeaceae bacterium]|jgi:hypothetical protein|nr:hypothetical protein [Zoogloeaceae bacterium]